MKPLRIAFLGAGGINRAHKVAFLRHPDRLAAAGVADPNEESARALAAELGKDLPVFRDHRALLESLRGRVDAALITTPHHLHHPLAEDVLRAGLPCLVEKPVTCSLGELRRLRALERPGVFVQAGQTQRFGQEENWIRRWLASPEFGEPRQFNLDIYQNVEGYTAGRDGFWILDGKLAGGGIVISVGLHALDLLRYWLEDDYVEVFAKGRFDRPFLNGAESSVVATLTTRRGVIGSLNCSYTATRCPYSQRTLLFGTHGTLAQHLDRLGGGYAGAYSTASDGGQPTHEWDLMYSGWRTVGQRMAEDLPGFFAEKHPACFVNQMLAFAEGVAAGRALENSLERNLNTIAVVEAIGRSLMSGRAEAVATA